ncbi:MAG: hypothetical protein RI955_1994 [Bacteroidota bacterium]|jgi:hypothetical protein
MQYNSQRGEIIIREYGRHIQKMVDIITAIEDREKRNHYAKYAIEMMGMLFPHLKNVEDFRHKLWDHLFIMSDFKLDVDSPYPTPTPDTVVAKPKRLRYPKNKVKFRHYGHNVEVLIEKALKQTDEEKQKEFAQGIAIVMKMTYRNWNSDDVNDDTIKDDLRMMSDGGLALDEDQRIANMQQRQFHQNNNNSRNNKNKKPFNNRGNNNNSNRNNNAGGGNSNGGNSNRNSNSNSNNSNNNANNNNNRNNNRNRNFNNRGGSGNNFNGQ